MNVLEPLVPICCFFDKKMKKKKIKDTFKSFIFKFVSAFTFIKKLTSFVAKQNSIATRHPCSASIPILQ